VCMCSMEILLIILMSELRSAITKIPGLIYFIFLRYK